MKYTLIIVTFLFGLTLLSAQQTVKSIKLQTPALDETSGLVFYNNTLITHNDSGGQPNLFEINRSTGAVTRTVIVSNATNVDWEDIAQDSSYIYIGDIGNNSGTRKDLKIYKISKEDYNDGDDIVTPEIISYSYENQIDFTPSVNKTNWDAEGLISYNDKLLIFTKNWVDNQVNVYSIPKTSGEVHRAVLESSYNTHGLVTGADISADQKVIFLTGYSSTAPPFIFTISKIPSGSLDVFSGSISEKIQNIVPVGNQVEGIALFEITPTKHRLYISNEKFVLSLGPITLPFPAKLWTIEIDNEDITLNVPTINSNLEFYIYPNPFESFLKLSKKVDEIIIYDMSGRIITRQYFVEELSLNNLQSGVYMAHIKIGDSKLIKKLIKK